MEINNLPKAMIIKKFMDLGRRMGETTESFNKDLEKNQSLRKYLK